jgi:hypothetical protein
LNLQYMAHFIFLNKDKREQVGIFLVITNLRKK